MSTVNDTSSARSNRLSLIPVTKDLARKKAQAVAP